MDPLSISASIIALLQLTSTVIEHLNEVRNASKEQREVAIEASNLYGLLVRLRYRIDTAHNTEDDWFGQIKALGSPTGPLNQLKESLEKLVGQLGIPGTEKKRDRIVSALQWHWNKGDTDRILQRIERLKSLITLALTDDLFALTEVVHNEVKGISMGISALEISTKADSLRSKISQWLNAPDPSSNYNAALKRRHPGTGSWLLKHETFLRWKDSSSSFLWLFGNAGCGKTFLCSTLLEDLLQLRQAGAKAKSIALCYFYFDFKDLEKQKCPSLLRSLIMQLYDQSNDPSLFQKAYTSNCNEGKIQPSENMLRALLLDAARQFQHVYIVLDALDECTEIDSLLTLLQEFDKNSKISVAATSRRKKEIEAQLSGVDDKINLTSSLVKADIGAYVRYQVTTDTRLKKWNNTVQEEIISALTQKANGMFQWVFCQLEALAKCIKLSNLKRTLVSLPKSLDDTYTRMFHDIEAAGYLDDAVIALQWLCFSLEPLDLSEIVETLAVQLGEDVGFDPDDRLPDPEDIKIVCSNLIICSDFIASNRQPEGALDSRNKAIKDPGQAKTASNVDNDEDFIGSIRLSHFSVQEYLLSDRCFAQNSFNESNCHAFIAEVCLAYMKHLFDIGSLDHELVELYPLTSYAAKYWFKHLQLLKTIPDRILDMALELLTDPVYSLAYGRIVGLDFWISDRVSSDFSIESSNLTPPLVQVAATAVPKLLAKALKVDTAQPFQPASLNSALVLAARSSSEANVRTLLSFGADIDGQGYDGMTALAVAAARGDDRLVQLLLKAGANVNIRAHDPYKDALSMAIPHRNTVQLLLDADADFAARYRALRVAIWQPLMVRMIIMGGVDAETEYGSSTPLQSLTNSKHAISMRMLMEAGADISVISAIDEDDSPLRNAIESGELEYVQLILDASGGCHNLISSEDPSLFMNIAAHNGHQDIVSLLLAHGAEIDEWYGQYGNSLQAAAASNQESVVQLLLEAGAAVNVKTRLFSSALQAAVVETDPIVEELDISRKYAKKGRVSTLEMTLHLHFLQADVQLPIRGLIEKTTVNAFSSSSAEPPADIVQIEVLTLLQQYPKPRLLQDEEILLKQSLSNLKQDLLAHLGSITLKDCVEKDIIASSTNRSLDELEPLLPLLCDLGATMDHSTNPATIGIPPREGPTPASYSLVENLLDHGADVNMDGGLYDTALQAASRHDNRDIVNLLMQRGAKVNAQGGIFGNALQAACATFCENLELVQLLLAAGANVHASGGLYGSALQAACHRSFENVVRLLLDKGANVNAKGGRYGNALQAACASPSYSVDLIKLLLDAGANPYAEGGIFGSARNTILAKSYRLVLLDIDM